MLPIAFYYMFYVSELWNSVNGIYYMFYVSELWNSVNGIYLMFYVSMCSRNIRSSHIWIDDTRLSLTTNHHTRNKVVVAIISIVLFAMLQSNPWISEE